MDADADVPKSLQVKKEDQHGSESTEEVSNSETNATSNPPNKRKTDTLPSDNLVLGDTKSSLMDSSIADESSSISSEEPRCIELETTKEIESEITKGEKVSPQKHIDSEVDKSQYVHYEGDIAVYTDPLSRQQYTWEDKKNEWKLRQIDYDFDGCNYFYSDKSGSKFKWDTASNTWVHQSIPSVPLVQADKTEDSDDEEEYDENNAQKTAPPIQRQDMSKGSYGFEGDTHTYTDAMDGTVYIWDKEKNAWFPKVDDDFLARYQMSYGFVDDSTPDLDKKAIPEDKSNVEEKPLAPVDVKLNSSEAKIIPGQKRKPEPPKWFDIGQESTKVYVSNLPLDLTQDEFVEIMQKCGLVMKELDTNQMKIKLYTDPYTKEFKGDALCTYIKRESVDLALNILDGHEIRGKKIKVERAKFTMKGESYDPNLKPKKKRKKDLEKLKKAQEKLFDWRPDKLRGERSKNETVIVVKNLFDPVLFDSDVTLILEYQQDLREECAKCGHVKKVVLHDKHPEGVAQIFFKEAEAADACKTLLNGRWFGQRQISAETWDGKARYKMQETAEEREKRLKKWETFLEEEDRRKREKAEGGGEISISEKESISQHSIDDSKSTSEEISIREKESQHSIDDSKSTSEEMSISEKGPTGQDFSAFEKESIDNSKSTREKGSICEKEPVAEDISMLETDSIDNSKSTPENQLSDKKLKDEENEMVEDESNGVVGGQNDRDDSDATLSSGESEGEE